MVRKTKKSVEKKRVAKVAAPKITRRPPTPEEKVTDAQATVAILEAERKSLQVALEKNTKGLEGAKELLHQAKYALRQSRQDSSQTAVVGSLVGVGPPTRQPRKKRGG